MSSLATLLEWHIAMGVDETLLDDPINHFDPPIEISPPAPQEENITEAPPTQMGGGLSLPPAQAIAKARMLADSATDLASLKAAIDAVDFLPIKKTAMNTVFSDGVTSAAIMFIGEAPGSEEDKAAIPFCGPSGHMLDKALSHIGLDRKHNCYISNSIFWRPPGNRRPTPEELLICLPFVEKHIALIKPQLIVLVGGTATSSILNEKQSINKLRGKYTTYTNTYLEGKIPLTSLFHPSYLLRQPTKKKLFWQDLLQISAHLQKNTPV